MGVDLCAEAGWDSLGEASKRWRVKRRRLDVGLDLHRHTLTRAQALPLPSRSATTATTTATTKGGRNFDHTDQDCCEQKKHRRSEARVERVGESCEGNAAANVQTGRHRRRHRLFLANTALVGKSTESIPKLALHPQTISWSLTRECRAENVADHRHHHAISMSMRTSVADDTPPTDGGGPLAAPHQPYDAAPRKQTNCTNFKGLSSIGEGNAANDDDSSGRSFSGSRGRDSSSSSSSPPTHGAGAVTGVDVSAYNHGGSSWGLRRHFPADALVPRAPLSIIFPVAPLPAMPTAARKAPTRIPPAPATTSNTAVPATDSTAPLPATPTARPKMSASGTPLTTPTRPKSAASERARGRPYTVSAGLQDPGLSWAGSPKGPTPEKTKTAAGVSPVPAGARPGTAASDGEGRAATIRHGDGGSLESTRKTPRGTSESWGAPREVAEGPGVVGLTAEVIESPGVSLDRSGRVTVVDKHMLAFDEVWPADLPALRPLRLNLRRPCGAVSSHGHGKGKGGKDGTRGEGEGLSRGPVFLMPMHREGKGVEGREDELFAEPPRLKRVDEATAKTRDRYCFEEESRHGSSWADKGKDRHSGDGSVNGERKWARCKLWEIGVGTWRWEWSPEARMMLGRLALWKGGLLVSRTHAFVTVFGLGMAGRVVVEGAPHPRGILVEAYVPASSETCQLHVSVEDLKRLFWNDPQKMWVGKKGDMLVELVKMLYFEYTLETEGADSSATDGIRRSAHHYTDREPWACLRDYRDADYDLHWESTRSTAANGVVRRGEGPDVAADTASSAGTASVEGETAGAPADPAALAGAAPEASSVATTYTAVTAIPDERAVWISQRLRIRSTQNLVDVDPELDAALHASGGGGDCAAAVPASLSATTVAARNGPRMRPNHRVPLIRTRSKAAPGLRRTRTRVRMKAFDIRVEEFKEERRHAEEEKKAKLQAWLAIKKRFRNLTLGTAVRISGRLLALMVYEFPDQPGNLRVTLTDTPSGGTFSVSLGIGPIAALARHASIAPNPDNWTLGQRRRLIKNTIRGRSAIVPVEEEGADGSSHRGDTGAKAHRGVLGRGLFSAVRCLGRDSTASHLPQPRTAAPGFARRRKAHQLQQPSPKDHRGRFPALLLPGSVSDVARPVLPHGDAATLSTQGGSRIDRDRSEAATPQAFGFLESPQTRATLDGGGVSADAVAVEAGDGKDGVAAESTLSAAALSVVGLAAERDSTGACGGGGLGTLKRLRPRRECGRGRRLCGGVARVRETPGVFSLLRGNWAGAEQEFILDWYTPWGFRPTGLGPVEAHTTFSLGLLTQDLYLFTEGLDLMGAAEKAPPSCADNPVGVAVPPSWGSEIDPIAQAPSAGNGLPAGAAATPPPPAAATPSAIAASPEHRAQQDEHAGAEAARGSRPPPSSTPAERSGKDRASDGGFERQEPPDNRQPSASECEAWDRVAREVLQRCVWKPTWATAAEDGRDPAGSEPGPPSLEEYVVSEISRTTVSGTKPAIEKPSFGETDTRDTTAVVQLAIGTCIFRRVIKVAGLGIPPKHLLVVVSQWHEALVVRCYDFLSGATREAERPDPDRDSALLLEFQNMTRVERDVQLQVMLDALVVFEDTAQASADSGPTWSVRFEEDAVAPVVVDTESDMYDRQVEEQMAAAAALVDKRREDVQRAQHAAREKDKRARERRKKREDKRREAMAKSRKTGGERAKGTNNRGRTTRGGSGGGGGRDAASEDASDDDSDGSEGG